MYGLKKSNIRAARRHEQERSEELKGEYKNSRKILTYAIKDVKEKSWRNLCDAVESDPW